MLNSRLIHPHILSALARAGHSSKILISDGNFPHWTRRGPNAEVVYLNLMPGVPTVTQVLEAGLSAVPIEAAAVMDYAREGPYALSDDPAAWKEYRVALGAAGFTGQLDRHDRPMFYNRAELPDVCLTIATGDQRIYANLLLTIGVVR